MSQQEQDSAAPDPGMWLAPPVTAHVQVVLDATGAHGTVVVDGTDVSTRVKSVHLTAEAGRPARVVLVANADGFSYEGPGVVKVVTEVPQPWLEAARQWLAGLDPAALQTAIAEGAMGKGIGESVKDVLLAELARA